MYILPRVSNNSQNLRLKKFVNRLQKCGYVCRHGSLRHYVLLVCFFSFSDLCCWCGFFSFSDLSAFWFWCGFCSVFFPQLSDFCVFLCTLLALLLHVWIECFWIFRRGFSCDVVFLLHSLPKVDNKSKYCSLFFCSSRTSKLIVGGMSYWEFTDTIYVYVSCAMTSAFSFLFWILNFYF